MKRQKLMVILLVMTTLTGCVQRLEYTEEQTDTAAEYMAGLLLKSDKNHKVSLLTMDEIIVNKLEEVQDSDTGEAAGDSNTFEEGDKAQEHYTLTEVIGEKDFSLKYEKYLVTESYPEDPSSSYFSINARPGNQLIVLSFILTNESKKDNNLKLSQVPIKYQLYINSDKIYEPPFALLENNLKLLDITLEKGKSEEVVLIFEVTKDAKMKDISLKVTRDERSETIKIK